MAEREPSGRPADEEHELKVTDTNGAEGTLQVLMIARTLEVTPAAARPRDTVTIIGRNFIADNSDGLSTTVDVRYQCGNSSRTTTADPDVSGNWRETLRIPSGCAIPSTNTITADINAAVITSCANTTRVSIVEARNLSVLEATSVPNLVMTQDAVKAVDGLWGKETSS